jgi:hypothetical protein
LECAIEQQFFEFSITVEVTEQAYRFLIPWILGWLVRIIVIFSNNSMLSLFSITERKTTFKFLQNIFYKNSFYKPGNTKGGFDWFGISCMAIDNFYFYLQNILIQTSQTGGQWYRDTSPFSIPCINYLRAVPYKL